MKNKNVLSIITRGGFRISVGGSAYLQGAPTYKFARFFQKLHEIKKISGTRRGRPALDPPLITFTLHICVVQSPADSEFYIISCLPISPVKIYKCTVIDRIKAQRLIKTCLSLEKQKSPVIPLSQEL